jgi:hypothetical protein
MPRGKLYSKVSNMICKKRELGGECQIRNPSVADVETPWDVPSEGNFKKVFFSLVFLFHVVIFSAIMFCIAAILLLLALLALQRS